MRLFEKIVQPPCDEVSVCADDDSLLVISKTEGGKREEVVELAWDCVPSLIAALTEAHSKFLEGE